MTDPKDPPLRGLSLHNPQLLSKEELERDFVARGAELSKLADSLRKRASLQPQHHLVLGHRGMGKTTLLHRLAHVIGDDPELSGAYLPLVFPEEQYNVGRLSDVWLNCLDALSDRLDLAGDSAASAEIDRTVDTLHDLPDDAVVEQRALDELVSRARRLQRRLVLLVDNIDLVLDRIGSDRQWAFRDVLERSTELVVIGASSAAVESTYDYGAAFYDFFRVHRLGPLTSAEARDVLLALSRRHGNERVERIIAEQPGRLEAVRVLAGGNPRTIVTLYSVLAAGPDGDVRGDLEALLDRHTPLYKARFEALPAQAQQVVDALCFLWDPASARQVANQARLDANAVSSQLARLQKEGIVEKVRAVDPETGAKRGRHAFQVTERFFNIWTMMRASRRVRRKLAWFVSCLELLYGPEEVLAQARRVLAEAAGRAENVAELALALSDVVRDEGLRLALVHRAIEAAEAGGSPLCEDGDDQIMAAENVRLARRARVERFRRLINSAPAEQREALGLVPQILAARWEVKLARTVAGAAAVNPALLLFRTVEQMVIDPALRKTVTPLVESGADALDADVLERVRGIAGPEAVARFELEILAVSEAVLSTLVLGGLVDSANGTDDVEQVIDIVGRDPAALGSAVVASASARNGRLQASASVVVEVLGRDEVEQAARMLLQLAVTHLVRAGAAAHLSTLFDDRGLSERYRPLREALRAEVTGNEAILDSLAPEVADAARHHLATFHAPGNVIRGV